MNDANRFDSILNILEKLAFYSVQFSLQTIDLLLEHITALQHRTVVYYTNAYSLVKTAFVSKWVTETVSCLISRNYHGQSDKAVQNVLIFPSQK